MKETDRTIDYDLDMYLYDLAVVAMDEDGAIVRLTQSQIPSEVQGHSAMDRVFLCRKYKVICDNNSKVTAVELFGARPLKECYRDEGETKITWGDDKVHFFIINPTNVEIIDLTSKDSYNEGEKRPFQEEEHKDTPDASHADFI